MDFKIRDEILEKALINKPKDYMKLEQEIKQSLQMNRQVQVLFSKEFFDDKTDGVISETKLDEMVKPGIVSSLANLSPGVQNFFSGMHFISWFTSSGIIILVILVLICYCRARRNKNRSKYMEMRPVEYERRNEPGNDGKIVINVGKEDKRKENEVNIANKRRGDIIKLIRSRSTNDIKK